MKRGAVLVTVGVLACVGSVGWGQATKEVKPGQPELQLPAGMTPEQMQACVEAATPGERHAFLMESVGVWQGKTTMWMTRGAEPLTSECKTTITPMMEGRFVRCETEGEIPGMGAFTGFGLYGFDNVSQSFQGTWVDNCGTGMMVGTGELSSDGTTLEWTFDYNCPMTGEPAVFREVERRIGEDRMTLTMYGPDPVTGEEYKVMQIEYRRVSKTADAGGAVVR